MHSGWTGQGAICTTHTVLGIFLPSSFAPGCQVLILSEHLQALTKAVDRMRSARFQSVTAGARVGRRRHATGLWRRQQGGEEESQKEPGLGSRVEVERQRGDRRAESSGQEQSRGWAGDGEGDGYRRDGAGAAERMQQQRIVEDEEVLAVSPLYI